MNTPHLLIRATALAFSLLLAAAGLSSAEDLHWNAAGTPADSFELTDGPVPNPQPGDQVFTAQNTCDNSTVRATFSNPDGVADPGEPFVDLRTADTIDWWIDGPASDPDELTLTIEFLGDPAEDVAFTVYDIDRGGWIDEYEITGTFVGAVTVNAASCGSAMTCTGSGTTTLTAVGDTGASFGGAPGNLVVDIPGPVQTISIIYRAADDGSLNGDQLTGISDLSFTCSTVPVTLSSFSSQGAGGRTRFDWTTATETSNVGFHIYGEVAGDWKRLNDRLIPSQSVDSLEPRSYSKTLNTQGAQSFVISDVDTRGREEFHGPFALGSSTGTPATPSSIDWEPIRARRDRQEASRKQERAATMVARASERMSQTTLGALSAGAAEARASEPVGTYDLRVSETGLYRVPFESVPGLEGVALDDLALTVNRRPVWIRVQGGDASGRFGPGSYVEFYGQALSTLYTTTNVYRLGADASKARRAREVTSRTRRRPSTSVLARTSVERDLIYSFASPNGDPWYETSMLVFDQPLSKTFEFEVDELTEGEATLNVDLWGVTDWPQLNPDHHVRIALNGLTVAEEWFDGLYNLSLEIPLPAGALIEGTNQLEITSLGDTGARYDLIHVDGYGATYERHAAAKDGRFSATAQGRALEVSNLPSRDVVAYRALDRYLIHFSDLAPSRDNASSYRVRVPLPQHKPRDVLVSTAESLLHPEVVPTPRRSRINLGRADYLIISHPDFIDHLSPLVSARRRDGLKVKVVDVEQIYAKYSGGVFSPEAIRRFIGHWTERKGTRYVLLVGGDTYDYFDNLGIGSVSFIPTVYETTHSVVRFAPSDASLADSFGDGTPDAAIGRFPVRTVEELELMIAKTLAYSPTGTALFAADERDAAFSYADISDDLATLLPNTAIERAYLDELGLPGARTALLDSIDSGVGLTHYFGHSGPAGWTFQGLLGASDPEAMLNASSPTVALQWGCWGGYHSVPQFDTLSHRLLLAGPQGAAAVLGASGLTDVASDRDMAAKVYGYLAEPGTRLGDAIQRAKEELGPSYRDVVLGMTLLGDPALVVN